MTKLAFFLVSLLFLIASGLTSVQAQDQTIQTAINQAESDYRYQFDRYRTHYTQYQISKSEWEKTKTIKAEQEALEAAKLVATQRGEVLKAYTLWIRLKLLEFSSVYPEIQNLTDRLSIQAQWFSSHQTEISATSSVAMFDEVMGRYVDQKPERDQLFASAQIHLKLAKLTSYQHLIRSLYEPILSSLQGRTDPAEIQQGLFRISSLAENTNNRITEAKTLVGPLESGDLPVKQVFRNVNEVLEDIRAKQLQLLELMNELDVRYVKQ